MRNFDGSFSDNLNIQQNVQLLVIWDAMMLTWCHSNVINKTYEVLMIYEKCTQ